MGDFDLFYLYGLKKPQAANLKLSIFGSDDKLVTQANMNLKKLNFNPVFRVSSGEESEQPAIKKSQRTHGLMRTDEKRDTGTDP